MAGILLSGCNGKMGRAVTLSVAETDGCNITAGIDVFDEVRYGYPVFTSPANISKETIDNVDVIIDFSNPVALAGLLELRGVNTRVYCQQGGRHCEADWEKQVPGFMNYLWRDR